MTSAGNAARTASHSRGSLIPIASIDGSDQPRGQHGVAEPLVKTREDSGHSRKRIDQEPLEDGVEESPFERNQEHLPSCAIRSQHAEVGSGTCTDVIADRVLEPVQVVENVRRAQELQQAKGRMPRQMDECERVPADGDFRDDDPDLRQRRIGQRRLHVALYSCRRSRKQRRRRAEGTGEEPGRECLF